MKEDIYLSLLQRLAQPVHPDTRIKSFLDALCDAYHLKGACYIRVRKETGRQRPLTVHHNLTGPWAQIWFRACKSDHDDLLSHCRAALRPIDWQDSHLAARADLLQADSHDERCEDQSRNCDHHPALVQQGLSFRLLSKSDELAVFTILALEKNDEWRKKRPLLERDIRSLADQFHASVMALDRHPQSDRDLAGELLTLRETEVLRWAAAGKTYWEISKILGISARTVRFFMTRTRVKLDAVSNAQAVAKAVTHGLIRCP